MAIFGCSKCRLTGETETWPVITVTPEPAKICEGRGMGHTRIICSSCRGPLQALSKRDLESDKFNALLAEPERMNEPSFLDLVIDDKRERAGEPPLPPANGTSGNGAGVSAPKASTNTLSAHPSLHSSNVSNLAGAEVPAHFHP